VTLSSLTEDRRTISQLTNKLYSIHLSLLREIIRSASTDGAPDAALKPLQSLLFEWTQKGAAAWTRDNANAHSAINLIKEAQSASYAVMADPDAWGSTANMSVVDKARVMTRRATFARKVQSDLATKAGDVVGPEVQVQLCGGSSC
jgi:hypothetical protein